MSETDFSHEFSNARFLISSGHYDYFGGAERQSIILAKALIEETGCSVDFLSWGGDGILADKVRELGLKPWVFPLPEPQNRLKLAVALIRLARFIKNEIRPDYLLPYVAYHSKVIGSIWRHTGARFTWWNQRDEGRGVHGTRTERRLMRTLPCIVSNSFEGRDFLMSKFNLPPGRVRVINNGVVVPQDTDGSVWRAKLGLEPDDFLISMIANLTPYKDHETLLRAFAILKNTPVGSKSKLVFAGQSGVRTKDLKALAFDFGFGNDIRMLGTVEDINGLLSASDLVAHSSVKEGCPNAVLEAMAHQRCVVGTNISGMRQALGDDATPAYLAAPGDAEQLAKIISRLITSPDERKEAGAKNRKRIESEFSVARMTNQVLKTVRQYRV